MSFESDVLAFKKDTEKGLEKSVRATYLQAYAAIIRMTPVDTGRARSNWFAGLNRVPTVTTKGTRRTVANTRTAKNTAKRFKLGNSISLVNNLPYIVALEDGHSKQARGGMVKVVFSRLERILYNKIKALK